uniref:Sulfotransferase family protein n=1 Tax=viral metagenome TaxID=1070528 RepID=A0A6M3J904_9ZZZZ
MTLLIPGRLIYLPHPRTGSTATEKALLAAFPGSAVGTVNQWNGPGRIHHGHAAAFAGHPARTGEEAVVSTVANPFDLVASWYRRTAFDAAGRRLEVGLGRPYLDVVDFVDRYGTEGSWFVNPADGRLFSWFLPESTVPPIRKESIEEDLERILGVRIRVGRENETAGKPPWRSYYDRKAVSWMLARFPEIGELGYGFDGSPLAPVLE